MKLLIWSPQAALPPFQGLSIQRLTEGAVSHSAPLALGKGRERPWLHGRRPGQACLHVLLQNIQHSFKYVIQDLFKQKQL